MRVAALKCLFEHKAGSPRRFRHQIYARIAEREPEAWALCGTAEQREKAAADPAGLPQGSHPTATIVQAWNTALFDAFCGLELTHVRGKDSRPKGHWTTELKIVD